MIWKSLETSGDFGCGAVGAENGNCGDGGLSYLFLRFKLNLNE